MTPRTTPRSARILNQWVDAHARRIDQPPSRVRNWVSHMILGGALERAGFDGTGRRFAIKGGVALELRLRHLARATRDLDLILATEEFDPVTELQRALRDPCEGFTFRLRPDSELMPNGAARVEVAIQYLGKPWGTVQVDVGRDEGLGSEVEMVDALPLEPFGLHGPESLPCLYLPFHIAQKIHAMTAPPRPGGRNDRFRDLVDLLLLRGWVSDYEAVRRACATVFARRGTHPWPPFFEVPEHWPVQFERMAADLHLETTDVYDAAIQVRRFITEIDASAAWIAPLPSMHGLTATTWYYAVGAGGELHRVPARVGEAYFTGDETEGAEIPTQWQRDPGGLALIGVVVYLRARRAVYVEGVSTRAVALSDELQGRPVEFGPDIWGALAAELLRRTHSPPRAAHSFAVYLSKRQVTLPCVLGSLGQASTQQAHWWRVHWESEWLLWDLNAGTPVSNSGGAK